MFPGFFENDVMGIRILFPCWFLEPLFIWCNEGKHFCWLLISLLSITVMYKRKLNTHSKLTCLPSATLYTQVRNGAMGSKMHFTIDWKTVPKKFYF